MKSVWGEARVVEDAEIRGRLRLIGDRGGAQQAHEQRRAVAAVLVGDRRKVHLAGGPGGLPRGRRAALPRERIDGQVRLERLVAGQPASIKYDPSNPVDSILVADDWSGLR